MKLGEKVVQRRRAKRLAYSALGLGILLFSINSGLLVALPAFIWLALLLTLGAAFWVGPLRKQPLALRFAGFASVAVLATATAGQFSGAAAVGFPALVFLLVYSTNPKRWWALLPGGILTSISLLLTFDALFPNWDATPILFLGLAATFTYLYLSSPKRGGKRWALYPAILFIILTVVFNDPRGYSSGWLFPSLLILAGGLTLWWWSRK